MIKPLADRVVVKPLPYEEKTSGGIVLPDTAKEKPQEGEVVRRDLASSLTTDSGLPLR